MPELPEVETTRLGLAERLPGARVLAARLGKPLRWPLGCEPSALVGRTLGEPARRGKYLWLPMTGGGLLVHLGMSGSLNLGATAAGTSGPYDHFELETTNGTLRLTDPRRFGAVVWSPALDAGPAARLLAGLGMEPFDPRFDGAHLHRAWRGRRVSVKQALLAGDAVVGAGNIYACEALFDAAIDPRTPAGSVSRTRCERLAQALRRILAEAVGLGGSTLRDFRDAHGLAGRFQTRARVYGRAGQPCTVCGTLVRRIAQGQRSTFYCPRCQRR